MYTELKKSGAKPVPFKRAIAQSIGYGPTSTASEAQEMFRKLNSLFDFLFVL